MMGGGGGGFDPNAMAMMYQNMMKGGGGMGESQFRSVEESDSRRPADGVRRRYGYGL